MKDLSSKAKSLQSIEKALGIVQRFILNELGLGFLGAVMTRKSSIRAVARALGCHHEKVRRKLKTLGEMKDELMAQLASCFVEANTVCLMDPTYTKKNQERLLVMAVVEEVSGRAVPVWWDYQRWEDVRENPPLSKNLLVESAVRKLKGTLGHGFILIADREFGSWEV